MEKLIEYIENLTRNQIMFFILLLVLVCYVNSLGVFFIWDDYALIVNNFQVQSFNIIDVFKISPIPPQNDQTNLIVYYRPIQLVSYMFDFLIWKSNAFGYHLMNILLHFVNCLLIFAFIKTLTHKRFISFLCSAIFAVNPIFTLSVTYISGRADVLALLFTLVMILFFIRAFEKAKPNLGYYILSVLSFMLAIFSKEIGLFAFLFLILIGINSNIKLVSFKKRFFAAYLIPAAIYFLSRPRFPIQKTEMFLPGSFNYVFDVLTIIKGNLVYLFKAIVPLDTRMQFTTHIINAFGWPALVILLLFIFFLTICIVLAKRLNKTFLYGIFWFYAPLLILIFMNIFYAKRGQEILLPLHNLYFSYPGLLVAFVALFKNKSYNINKLISVVLCLVIVFYAIITVIDNDLWHDEIAFFKRIVNFNKDSQFNNIPYANLAFSYERAKEYKLAEDYFSKAIELSNNKPISYNTLASYYLRRKDFDKAIKSLEDSLKFDRNFFQTYLMLGIVYLKKGDKGKARENFKIALTIQQNDQLSKTYLKSIK